jgi:hypothetical protein
MQVLIATFAAPSQASQAVSLLLERFRIDPKAWSLGTVAAQGEPYHGHRLLAAWIDDQHVVAAGSLVQRIGGALHEPPVTAAMQPPVGLVSRD